MRERKNSLDAIVPVKKIYRFHSLGEMKKNNSETQIYTQDELSKMLSYAKQEADRIHSLLFLRVCRRQDES